MVSGYSDTPLFKHLLSTCHVLGILNAFNTSLHAGFSYNSGMLNNLPIKHFLASNLQAHFISPPQQPPPKVTKKALTQ